MKVNDLLNLLIPPIEKVLPPIEPILKPIELITPIEILPPPTPELLDLRPSDPILVPDNKIFGKILSHKALIVAALIIATALSFFLFLVSFFRSKYCRSLKQRIQIAKSNAKNKVRRLFSHCIPGLRLNKQSKEEFGIKKPSRFYQYLACGKRFFEKLDSFEKPLVIASAINTLLFFKKLLFDKNFSPSSTLLFLPYLPLVSSKIGEIAQRLFGKYLPNLLQVEKRIPNYFIPILNMGKSLAAKLPEHKYKLLYVSSFVTGLFASTLIDYDSEILDKAFGPDLPSKEGLYDALTQSKKFSNFLVKLMLGSSGLTIVVKTGIIGGIVSVVKDIFKQNVLTIKIN